MKLIKWAVSDTRLLFFSDRLSKGVNKTGNAFCWAIATRDNWSADGNAFMYICQRVKLWHSRGVLARRKPFVGHNVNVSIIKQSFD